MLDKTSQMLYITLVTTKTLIEELKKADPGGELEVTIGKTPIHIVELSPAYYDGCLQKLVHDPFKAPYYDIVGGVITSKGHHVNIHTLNIEDALYEDPTMPVQFDLEGEGRIKDYKDRVEGWRTKAMMVIEETDIKIDESNRKIKR